MTKTGIVTLTVNFNFGNRLQNFALQAAVRVQSGDQVETIRSRERHGDDGPSLNRRLYRLRHEGFDVVRKSILSRIERRSLLGVAEAARRERIDDFVHTYIDEVPGDFLSEGDPREFVEQYRKFVVGSDQVWNPRFGLREGLDFLQFARPEQRIAYAASIGPSTIPDNLRRRYRDGLKGIPSMSVREESAAATVYELTGRRVPVVLDPTMLHPRAIWEDLAQTPAQLAGRDYALQFFLSPPAEEMLDPLRQYAATEGVDVVDLNDHTNMELYALSPLEFLGAISGARWIATDSFHAAAFSTLFNVPFLLKGRSDMNSRFDTLLRKTGLTWPEWKTRDQVRAALEIDWAEVNVRVARERADSLAFLQGALGHVT